MKNTNTNTWTFAANTVTVNNRTFDAKYSIGKAEDVFVFAKVNEVPIRVHIGKDMPEYAAAIAAARAEAEQPKAEAPAKPEPKPAQDAKPEPKPAQDAKGEPKPEQPKAEAPAKPAKKAQPKQAKAAKPAKKAEPKQPKAAKPAKKAEPKPEQPKPAQPASVDKSWIGTTIKGKGFNIAFDEKTQRTRVLFQAEPTQAQKDAINAAGFFWSAQLNSWNKKLTCKAHRAARALAETLNALAA